MCLLAPHGLSVACSKMLWQDRHNASGLLPMRQGDICCKTVSRWRVQPCIVARELCSSRSNPAALVNTVKLTGMHRQQSPAHKTHSNTALFLLQVSYAKPRAFLASRALVNQQPAQRRLLRLPLQLWTHAKLNVSNEKGNARRVWECNTSTLTGQLSSRCTPGNSKM